MLRGSSLATFTLVIAVSIPLCLPKEQKPIGGHNEERPKRDEVIIISMQEAKTEFSTGETKDVK